MVTAPLPATLCLSRHARVPNTGRDSSRVGSSKAGAEPREVTERVIRTTIGIRVTLERRKGMGVPAIEAAPEQAPATIRDELAGEQTAA
jgi:hypothetical protein